MPYWTIFTLPMDLDAMTVTEYQVESERAPLGVKVDIYIYMDIIYSYIDYLIDSLGWWHTANMRGRALRSS